VCDSRGFTELTQHGCWTISPAGYVEGVQRYHGEIGLMQWAAPQDWMCEPFILAKTGLSVTEHQHRTVGNLLTLRIAAPWVRFIPVLQGWTLPDYLRCVGMYAEAGIDLRHEAVVGLGSVCRRQATSEIHTIASVLTSLGISLHGFGVKTAAIEAVGSLLASADSAAWSYAARRRIVHCAHGLTKWAANCRDCALAWRVEVIGRLGSAQLALPLFGVDAA